MLAFLHTAAVHVPTFTRIARELAPQAPTRHSVRDDLLAHALADGRVSEETRAGTQGEVQRMVAEGATIVLCTCSTLGRAAEETPRVAARVMRVDRPMAEQAAAAGRPVLVVAATSTAMASAITLLRDSSRAAQLSFRELLCSAAWARFQSGDQVGYAAALAEQVDANARPSDVVMLAQASMAPAAALIRRKDIEVLTSPDVGVRAALALLGANDSAASPRGVGRD